MEKEKFEHYVPQFYLRRFVNNPKQCNKHASKCRLTVFDKSSSRKFGLPVNRAAGEGGFYKEPFEGKLEAYETEAGPVINSIVKSEDCRSLSEHEKDVFAKFIAIQDARTQVVRSVIEESYDEIRRIKGGTTLPSDGIGALMQSNLLTAFQMISQVILESADKNNDDEQRANLLDMQTQINQATDQVASGEYPDLFRHGTKIDRETLRQSHVERISKNLTYAPDNIKQMRWVVIKNSTTHPFWTSDNPLVNAVFFGPFVPSLGRTIGMFLPISPELGVGFSPSKRLSAYQRVINEDGVYALNRLQLMQSAKYIFTNEPRVLGDGSSKR